MAEGGSRRRTGAVIRGQGRQSGQGQGPASQRKFGLPKSARLLRSADYRKVYAEGRRRNLGMLVAFSRATGKQPSRVGMAVSRTFGGAVERNRLKRRLREAVRRNQADLGPGWDIVFHPRAEAKAAKFTDLEAVVRSFFKVCAQAASGLNRTESARETGS